MISKGHLDALDIVLMTVGCFFSALISPGNSVGAASQAAERISPSFLEEQTGQCGYLVPFEGGVLVERAPGSKVMLPKPIADKWLAVGGPTSILGCPREASISKLFNAGGRSSHALKYAEATFESGHIIYNPTAGSAFYISDHFELLRRRLEQPALYNIGLPVSDPMSGEGISEWQLFQVPGNRSLNAMEMRIDPPTLYVTRHPVVSPAWFPIDPSSTEVHRDTQRIEDWVRDWATDRTASPKWEAFACESIVGPCDQTRYETPNFPRSGEVCGWTATPLGPPEWQPLLYAFSAGPDWMDRGVDSDQLHQIVQMDPLRALDIMLFRGRPDSRDWGDVLRAGNRPIFWYSTAAEGIVTNSHLSGSDFGATHRSMPPDWELGDPSQVYYRGPCNPVLAQGQLCNDWNLSLKLDPEFDYLLAAPGDCRPHPAPRPLCYACCDSRFPGNFDEEDLGTLPIEIEQWQVPGGFRPEIGDRIMMVGRWIVDCGHDHWSTEIHPIEAFVTSHNSATELSAESTLTNVILTSAWMGSRRDADGQMTVGTTVLNLYPPVRPTPDARLIIDQNLNRFGIETTIEAVPRENPNHFRLTLRMIVEELLDMTQGQRTGQGSYGDFFYANNRRLIGSFTLYWK
ncbi:MAG: hypothetical protein HYR55_19815 [Acidobacteria bacterium]|nr:hypothetical protein [Acidobacteriota bacterium]MBI3658432.1 hypothetical protein [Acidobacteriota bacterium]